MKQQSLPRRLEAVLANRFGSAALLVLFFSVAVWFPTMVAGNIPILAAILALTLHLMTMILFSCLCYGGGSRYGFEVGLLATLGVFLVSTWNVDITLVFLLAYVLVPLSISSLIMVKDGLNRSLGLLSACCCVLFILISMQSDVPGIVKQSIALQFDMIHTQQMGGDASVRDALQRMQELIELFLPAVLMQAAWLVWLWSMLAGRWVAWRYCFYSGDLTTMSSFGMSRNFAVLLFVLLTVAVSVTGDIHYIALSLLLFIAGLFSFQGVIVAREWLRKRNSNFAVGVMYIVLFIQPLMLIPFVLIGLLDVHFDYRCMKQSISGGE